MARRQIAGQELVSATKMAAHFGVERSYLDTLVSQGVVEKRPHGLYDQTASRLRYFAHLRTERRRSPKSEADIAFQQAKTSLIQLGADAIAGIGENRSEANAGGDQPIQLAQRDL
jgi:hypothetical protein